MSDRKCRMALRVSHPAVQRKFSPGEEQAFKREMIRVKQMLHPERTYFEVENEEKEPGFPDTIEVFENNKARFVEYKVSDEKGSIEFQRGQPLWYRRNRKLDIRIIAWCVPDNEYWVFTADDVLEIIKGHAKDRKVSIKGGMMV